MLGNHNFKSIVVVGAGQMGSGIAQVCASQSIPVSLIDSKIDQLNKSKESICKSLEKLAAKGIIKEDEKISGLEKIKFSQDLKLSSKSDLIIEAIVEDENKKKTLWKQLDQISPPQTIFASNTSSIPIARLAQASGRPEKFIGLHFMNPVPIMNVVEIIPSLSTTIETKNQVLALCKFLKKETIESKDFPGFIINRILMPMINEAFTVLNENIASAEDIDKGMKLGTKQPMGPLALADFIGLDTCLAILTVMFESTGKTHLKPSPLLQQYVDLKWLGRKTNRGVYQY